MRYAHATRTVISEQRLALRARYANSFQFMRYAHATRTAFSYQLKADC
ncbi:MAG: hypothetical protein F6K55_39665 [Moorea sp. SIO4A3]|nr:hypothetical protein [Moorena sp. SIO4A3]